MIAWIRSRQSNAKLRFAALLSLVVLVAAVGIVSANGGMRPPSHGGMWGPRPGMWYYSGPIPTFTIIEVVKNQDVFIKTSDFPENEDFVVTMGPMGTRGINGTEVTVKNSSTGGTQEWSFTIPEELQDMKQISIRLQTEHENYPYYAFNWFYNTTATVNGGATAAATTEDTAAATEGEATTTEGEATTTEGEATTTEGEATTTEGEATTTEGEATTTDTGLVGIVWQWQSVTDPVQGEVAIEMPEQYTIEFSEDGRVNIKADCNVASGSYMAEDSSLTVAVETSTRALCAEDSLSDDFLTKLNAAAIYFFQDGDLFMDMVFDSGTLQFGDAASANAESAIRGTVSKTASQDDAVEEAADDPVPSFTICSVERGVSVSIVTADFPADSTFTIQMGVVQKPPMKKGSGMGDMGQMPMPMPQPMPMDNMGMGSMGMDMSMDMGSQWHKPMAPKIWIPYYDAGELETGDGGELEATLDIPAQLAGAYKINILMRTDDGYMSYNWFYNNTADVCENDQPAGG